MPSSIIGELEPGRNTEIALFRLKLTEIKDQLIARDIDFSFTGFNIKVPGTMVQVASDEVNLEGDTIYEPLKGEVLVLRVQELLAQAAQSEPEMSAGAAWQAWYPSQGHQTTPNMLMQNNRSVGYLEALINFTYTGENTDVSATVGLLKDEAKQAMIAVVEAAIKLEGRVFWQPIADYGSEQATIGLFEITQEINNDRLFTATIGLPVKEGDEKYLEVPGRLIIIFGDKDQKDADLPLIE